jgi:integrase
MLKRQRNGTVRDSWYGKYFEDGTCRVINLNVPVRGTPPPNADAAFDRSRERAVEALARHVEDSKRKGRADHLTEKLIESKTGRKVEYVRLSDLAARWRGLPRETDPGKDWLAWCDSIFNRFAAAFPGTTFLHEITPKQAGAYRNSLAADYSRRTSRGAVQMLKGAFARLLPVGAANPFAGAIARPGPDDDAGTVHRRPFTPDELQTLFAAARRDDFLFPLVVTAACTGMRRGDVCRLSWKSVDLAAGVLAVKTHKTGAAVEIPIFPPLREVLETARESARPASLYVWPAAARMIEDNPDGLTWRFKRLVAETFPAPPDPARLALQAAPPAVLSECLPAVEKAVSDRLEGPRRERVLTALRRYAAGETIRGIGKPDDGKGDRRGQVSTDLRDAETISGIHFLPIRTGPSVKDAIAQATRAPRETGKRAASVLDWHALRVTWVTLALAAGVPIETARLVTGHESVNVVLRHYFKPGRETLRAALLDKMPAVLTGGQPAPAVPAAWPEVVPDWIRVKLAAMTPGNWNRIRNKLMKAPHA